MPFYTGGISPSGRQDVFNVDNIQFVDADVSASGNGKSPRQSVKTITEGVTNVAKGGIVYVRPKTTVASAQGYYIDNITVPLTKPGMKILGCSADASMPYMGVSLKASTVTSPVLTIYSAGTVIEGLEITGTGQTADVTSIVEVSNNGSTTRAYGFTIRDCTLRNSKGHTIGLGAAIHIDTAIYGKIQNCLFRDNPVSIAFQTTYAAVNSLLIEGNVFSGAVAVRDADIWTNGDGGTGLLIHNNRFPDALPALSDGAVKKYISVSSGIYGMISECKFGYAASTADALFAATGTIINCPTSIMVVNCQVQMDTEGETGVLTV